MAVRSVRVWRGWVTVVSGDEPEPPAEVRPNFTPVAWLEHALDAAAVGEARSVSVRHKCQMGGGLEYVAYLGATYRPGASGELRVRVGVSDSKGLTDIGQDEARPVLAGLVEELAAWPERPAGEIVVDHAIIHQVDNRDWAWRAAARMAAALFRPGADRLDDEGIQALAGRYLRDELTPWSRPRDPGPGVRG